MIVYEIFRKLLPHSDALRAKTVQFCSIVNTISNHCWNQVTRSSQFVEILLPSLHYSSYKVAATMKFVSFNINGLRARPHQLAAIVENTNRM